MKKIFFIVIVLIAISCDKNEYDIGGAPEILFKKSLPKELNGYDVSNPIVYDEYLIIPAGSDYENNATYFKLSKNGDFVGKWNVNTNHCIQLYETYIYKNQLVYNSYYFGVPDNKIVSIDLDNMTTNWEINSISSRSGLFGLKDKIYITQYVTSGLNFFEINLNTLETNLVYHVKPVEYGAFVEVQQPFYYEIDANNIGILVASSDDSGFILLNFNITTQQLIWKISLAEFNYFIEQDVTHLYASAPKEVQLNNEYIIINSNSHISVRRLTDGSSIWYRDRNIDQNQDMPVTGEGVITDSTKKLYCYNISDGVVIWTREDKQDGIWTGFNEGSIIYQNYLFDAVPINLNNGNARWVKLDSWGELDLEFTGKPGIDKSNDNLYYVNRLTRKLYKVAFPR